LDVSNRRCGIPGVIPFSETTTFSCLRRARSGENMPQLMREKSSVLPQRQP
jgi:hypothetical protein